MLDVGRLATLRAVLEHGSFSAAGQALGLTQPAVSRQITLLERQAGAQLVRRARRGVSPTEAGRLLAEHAGAVLDRLALAEAQLAELAGLRRGRVRLGSFFTAFAVLTPRVAALAEARMPDLAVEHELVDRGTAFRRLIAGELDLAVVFEHDFEPDPAPAELELVPLFSDPARILLPARHRLAARPVLALEDLAGETWIRAQHGSAARLVDHVLAGAGLRPPLLLAGSGDEPVEGQVYVVAGDGVALAYRLNVLINPAETAVRPLAGPAPARRVQAALLRGQRTPGAQALLEVLRELAPPATGGGRPGGLKPGPADDGGRGRGGASSPAGRRGGRSGGGRSSASRTAGRSAGG
jgi:DNA-binding transcriptional LysR family regulator